jgi:RNA polymerase sigma factor (sigma-70 family)
MRLSPEEIERMVAEHEPLARYAIKHLRHCGAEPEDLEQVARIALHYAATHYDPERGTKFSTFAVPCIRALVLKEIGRQDCWKTGELFHHREQRRRQQKQGEPVVVPPPILSLDALRTPGGDRFLETLESEEPEPEEAALARVEAAGVLALVGEAGVLSPREARVIRGRFLAEPRESLREVAVELRCSKEQVRVLEARALGKLREACQERGLELAC